MQRQANDLRPRGHRDPVLFRAALVAAVLFAIPLVATRLSGEVNWSGLDFAVWGALLLTAAGAFLGLSRLVPPGRRWIAAIVIGCLFLYVWAELAVGIFLNFGS